MKGVEPQQTAFAGKIIFYALFWNPEARCGRLVHTNEKTGGTGYDKTKAGADDMCDDDENNRG